MNNNENGYEEQNSINTYDYIEEEESTTIKVNNESNKKNNKNKNKKRSFSNFRKNKSLPICQILLIIIILLILGLCIILFIKSIKKDIIEYNGEDINDVDLIKEENINDKKIELINDKEIEPINDKKIELINDKKIELINDKKIEILNDIKNENNITNKIEEVINKFVFNSTHKLKIAFMYSSLYANGIARFISVTANNLIKTGKYDIYVITEYSYSKDYWIDNRIMHLIAKNRTLIKMAAKDLNIDVVILQNVAGKSTYNFYKGIGKKVIGMFHGLFMSGMFHGGVDTYKTWDGFDCFDSFVFIGYDDYFFYKKLGFKNEIFVPNLYTFEPSEVKSSNLTGHNIVMLGRAADKVKGFYYGIKTMPLILKEVPDAKLIILSSNSKINFLKEYAKNLSVYDNIIFNEYTSNITEVFWKSSVLMYTSLSEAFPLAMVEGKAHGLPVAAFDVAYSAPYQKGVIGVDMLDCQALANEVIKLLKDYDYRKKMGEESKKSLDQFSNNETIFLWERLFTALMEGENSYRKLQKEIEEKYYDEDKARERMEKRFRDLIRLNENFTCHSIMNFTDINYIKKVKMCPYNKTNNESNSKNLRR